MRTVREVQSGRRTLRDGGIEILWTRHGSLEGQFLILNVNIAIWPSCVSAVGGEL